MEAQARTALLPVAALMLVTATLAACGGGGNTDSPASTGGGSDMGSPASTGAGVHAEKRHRSPSSSEASVDRAFAQAMIPHHRSALRMAELARGSAELPFVKQLARDIIRTQQAEIRTLRAIDGELEGEGLKVGELGVPHHMRGMDISLGELRDANPFERMFVDMMIPHHQGAIAMAQAELAKGDHAKLKKLARQIIDAQHREIDRMNEFRTTHYGAGGSGTSRRSRNNNGPNTSGQNRAHRVPPQE